MRQLSFCLIFGFVAVLNAQDDGVKAESITSCYVGRTEGGGFNISNFTVQNCSNPMQGCQTKFEVNDGKMIVQKDCHERKACFEQQDKTNELQCYSGHAFRTNARICLFCCRNDLCNTETTIPRPP